MNDDRSPEYFHNSSVGLPPSTFWLVALFFVFVTLSEVANCSIKSSVKRLIIDAAFTFCFRSSSSFAAEARNWSSSLSMMSSSKVSLKLLKIVSWVEVFPAIGCSCSILLRRWTSAAPPSSNIYKTTFIISCKIFRGNSIVNVILLWTSKGKYWRQKLELLQVADRFFE